MIAPSAVRLIKSLSVSDLPLVGQEVPIQSILSDLHRSGCVLVGTSARDGSSLADLIGCPQTALYGILTQPDIIRLLIAGADLATLGVGEAVANFPIAFYTISGLVDPLSPEVLRLNIKLYISSYRTPLSASSYLKPIPSNQCT